jgi:hypothetical protein
MVESTKGVLEFLEQLRRDRSELDVLIAGIEKRLGISPNRAEKDAGETSHQPVPTVKVTIGDIPLGFFHNLSQPAAAEKLLRLNPGQPLSSQEMLDAFRKSGLHLNPKNAATILYTALKRNPKFERVAGKAWGLTEWYSNGKKKTERRVTSKEDSEARDLNQHTDQSEGEDEFFDYESSNDT